MTILVNLLSGPGTGKSTAMHGLIFELRKRGVLAEMAPEWIKMAVWEKRESILEDQLYIFAKQARTIRRLWGQVDIVVTDSPLLLSLIYAENMPESFADLVFHEISRYSPQVNVMLERVKPYETRGRLQSEDVARMIDARIASMLVDIDEKTGVDSTFYRLKADADAPKIIADRVLEVAW